MLNKSYNVERKKIWPKVLMIFFIILIIFISLSIFFFNSAVKAANSDIDQKVEFIIDDGQGVKEISSDLKEAGLLKNPLFFMIYLRQKDRIADLKAGHYVLNKKMSIVDIAEVLVGGKIKSSKVTIVEGMRVEEVAKKLEAENIVKEKDFLEAVELDYDYDFLKGNTKDQGLEGFLFPDTYFLTAEISAEQMVEKMLNNFSKKLTKEMIREAESQGFDILDIVTLASIIEREASKNEDRALISGVLKNRLAIGMPLQADATNHYIVNDWKKGLTAEDLAIESPYNTRIHKGLPPGPICSPGLDSIKAAIYHKDSDYLYYLSAPDGTTYFSYTLEEHDQKKAEHLR